MRNNKMISLVVVLVMFFSMGIGAHTVWAASPESDFTFDTDTGTITSYIGPGGAVDIPSSIGGLPVTSIGGYAFSACTSLTSVTIPSSVMTIGDSAFEFCTSLTSITIPSSVTTIGISAFSECASLKSATISSGVTTIGMFAFSDCTSLTSITIPSSVTNIGESVFYYCTSLTSVTISSGVTSIDDGEFYHCDALTSAYFNGDAPTNFGTNVFDYTAPGFTIYYKLSSTGFTSPTWNGYPTATFITNDLLTPPSLEADSTHNVLGAYVDIIFIDNAKWRASITSITADGAAIPANKYKVSAGKIRIAKGVLNTIGDHTIVVKTTGYADDSVNQPITLVKLCLISGTVGTPYNVTLKAVNGTKPYIWSAEGLPEGLSLDRATGVISGIPTKAGRYTILVTAHDNAGHTTSASMSLVYKSRELKHQQG